MLEHEPALEQREQSRGAKPLFAGRELNVGGAQHLGGRREWCDEPRAGQRVGAPDEEKLAAESMGDPLARHENGTAGQRPLDGQRRDCLGPGARTPEDSGRPVTH